MLHPHQALGPRRCLAALVVAALPASNAQMPHQLPKGFKNPNSINNYGEYLKYAGQALGYLPIEPEADAPAPGPGGAFAPDSAPAGAAMHAGLQITTPADPTTYTQTTHTTTCVQKGPSPTSQLEVGMQVRERSCSHKQDMPNGCWASR